MSNDVRTLTVWFVFEEGKEPRFFVESSKGLDFSTIQESLETLAPYFGVCVISTKNSPLEELPPVRDFSDSACFFRLSISYLKSHPIFEFGEYGYFDRSCLCELFLHLCMCYGIVSEVDLESAYYLKNVGVRALS